MNHPAHQLRAPPQLAAIALSTGTRHLRLGPDVPSTRSSCALPHTRPATSSQTAAKASEAVLALSAGHRIMALSWTPSSSGAEVSFPTASGMNASDANSGDCAAETGDSPMSGGKHTSGVMHITSVAPQSPGLIEESPERKRPDNSLRDEAASTSAARGKRVFRALVSEVSQQIRSSCTGDKCPSSEASVKESSASSGEETRAASATPRASKARVEPGQPRIRTKRVATGPPGRRARDQVYHTRSVRRTKWVAKGPPGRKRQRIDLPSTPSSTASETSEVPIMSTDCSSSVETLESESVVLEEEEGNGDGMSNPQGVSWWGYFAQLMEYKSKKGDVNVPSRHPDNTALAYWVARQRQFHAKKMKGERTPLTDEQIEQLEGLGFVWKFGEKDCPDTKVAKLARVNVGTIISVLWPDDGKYYPAQVTGRTKKGTRTLYTLLYDTGDVETLDLSGESFRVVAGNEQELLKSRKRRKTGSPRGPSRSVACPPSVEEASEMEEKRFHSVNRLRAKFGEELASLFDVTVVPRKTAQAGRNFSCDAYWIPREDGAKRLRSLPEVERYLRARGLLDGASVLAAAAASVGSGDKPESDH